LPHHAHLQGLLHLLLGRRCLLLSNLLVVRRCVDLVVDHRLPLFAQVVEVSPRDALLHFRLERPAADVQSQPSY
jgi:hypothetical protein